MMQVPMELLVATHYAQPSTLAAQAFRAAQKIRWLRGPGGLVVKLS
jgi:hypothetical protein